jgi:phosphoribosylaminoimidazole-succinocarboxamide synthase
LATAPDAVYETALQTLPLLHRGKVRDVYAVDAEHLLIVTTDRLSAFDVVMPNPIPGKGRVLHQISEFWFDQTAGIISNHRSPRRLADLISDPAELAMLEGRASIVRRLRALPIEAVVRGYLSGSGWKDYQKNGGVCGHALPTGLRLADALPEPIFTPATKAAAGSHDENIDFATVTGLIGAERASAVRAAALALYGHASVHARARGIIIADTKFEFGVDAGGRLLLIDEVLTPDSSRFWPAATWHPGVSPPSFDKQYVRDYLESLDWDKRAPGPNLPAEVIARTAEKYAEALARLTGPPLASGTDS